MDWNDDNETRELIKQAGGRAAVARRCRRSVSTVGMWSQQNYIPDAHLGTVQQMAAERMKGMVGQPQTAREVRA